MPANYWIRLIPFFFSILEQIDKRIFWKNKLSLEQPEKTTMSDTNQLIRVLTVVPNAREKWIEHLDAKIGILSDMKSISPINKEDAFLSDIEECLINARSELARVRSLPL